MAKLLVIEDDSSMQHLYKRAFSFNKHQVFISGNGVDGLEKVKEVNPDIILLDIMMPKMNGMQVLDELKKDLSTKNIPVIMLTNIASGSLPLAEEAVKNGAVSYIIKSDVEPKDVVKMTEEILEKYSRKENLD